MQSAPATIPATIAYTFTAAFAPALTGTPSSPDTSPASPQQAASAITGTSPAQPTKLGSSHRILISDRACNNSIP